jgi:MFS family permease
VVSVVLSSTALGWPANYALLFLACGVTWALSLVSFLFIREAPLAAVQAPQPWPAYFRRLAAVVHTDKPFRRAVAAQLCLGSIGMAAPFYIVHGLDNLGFPASSVGVFTSVQLVGAVFGALLVGLLGEKRGTRSVMRVWGALALAAPGVGIAAPLAARLLPGAVLPVYAVAFVIVGVQGIASLAGFMNWVLGYAPASERPLYIGFANTLGGLTLVMPLIGGWILAASGSYLLLFSASAVGPCAALILLRGLPEPRHQAGPA